jgi:ribosomal protein L11 methyltransferase
MAYLAVSFELNGSDPERAEAACFELGALSVTFSDLRETAHPTQAAASHAARTGSILEPLPGEVRLWPDTRVQALFPAECAEPALLTRLAAALGVDPTRLQAQALPDRAWEREWLQDFHPMRFGRRLWICPRHEHLTHDEAVVVRLDPGLAFGTGTHPSTAMCLEWLDGADLTGRRVVDYGCGSGVLAIASLRLGAQRAYAFDIDAQALLATRENAIDNGVQSRLRLCERHSQLPRRCEVLLANILSKTLLALSTDLAALVVPHGQILLAGILAEDEPEVAARYAAWFDMKCHARRAGWVTLRGQRRSELV